MEGYKRPSRRQRLVAVLAPPLIVAAFVAAMYDSMLRRRESTDLVQHTQRVIGQLDAMRARLLDAESSQRAYIITADTEFLKPYQAAQRDTRRLLSEIARETRDNPRQQASVRVLAPLVSRRLGSLDARIDVRDSQGFQAARDSLAAGNWRALMDSIHGAVARMSAEEQSLLAERTAAQERYGGQVLWTLLVGALLVGVVSVLTGALFRRDARELAAANRHLRQANAVLRDQAEEMEMQAEELQTQAAQVADTMAELEIAHDEMQMQRAELEQLSSELTFMNRELEVANAALRLRTAEAEAANRAKTDFLSGMSHELRTPLNAIRGYVDLMELGVHGPLTEAQRTSLERIRHNGQHLLVLITDILNFARIEAGKIDLHVADVDVGELLLQVASMVQPLATARELELDTGMCEPGVLARGDHDRVAQVLLNLLTNAVKCTEPGGSVQVWCDAEGDRVRIHVRDTGVGIAPDRQEVIFEPFVQLTPGGALAEGVGLGLSISRELARAMRGELTVVSAPGQGSTFTLALPAAVRIPAHKIVAAPATPDHVSAEGAA